MINTFISSKFFRKALYTLFFSLLMTNTSFSAEQGMIEYQIKSELFMKRLIIGNINEAYDLLFIGSPLKANPKNLLTLNGINKQVIAQYGKPLSFEFVKQKKYSANTVSVQYLLKSDKFPLIWEFYYYKPKDEWIITKINFLKS